MSKINIDKVKQIVELVLGEQGKSLYISPIFYALALMLLFTFVDNNYADMVMDVIKFGIAMWMIVPVLLVVQKFVSDSEVQRIITLPASTLDKYVAMLTANAIQIIIWFVIMTITEVMMLIITNKLLYGIEISVVLAAITDPIFLRLIIPMMYIAALVGWGKVAARTTLSRRIIDYVLMALLLVGYIPMLFAFANQGTTAVIVALTIYEFAVILFALVRSYYNFKKIISYENN